MNKKYYLTILSLLMFIVANAQFVDDIESYPTGTLFNNRWTTWNGVDDGLQNAEVSTDFAASGTKSIKISPGAAGAGPQDVVLDFEGVASSGLWNAKWLMYIPSGQSGYFNIQGNVAPNAEANMQFLSGNITFNSENLNPGFVEDSAAFDGLVFPHDEWFLVAVVVDLDNETYDFHVNNDVLEFIPFSNFSDRFDGIDFFSVDDFCLYYIDDVELSQGPLVIETIPPVANCVAPFTVALDSNGIAFVSPEMIDDGSTDNSGVVDLSLDIGAFICPDVGTDVDVTLTVTDPSGNTDQCTTVVTVVDNIDPNLSCVTNKTIMLDQSGMAQITVNDIEVSSFDNCGIATKTLDVTSFDCSNIGDNTVTLTVTDFSGNSVLCTSTVTVVPFLTCAANTTVSINTDSCTAENVLLVSPVTSEVCSTITSVINNAPSEFQLGVTEVVWTVNYSSGAVVSCSQIVTVIDDESPIVSCPDDIIVEVLVGETYTMPDFTTNSDTVITDNCSAGISIEQSPVAGTVLNPDTYDVIISAQDTSGNIGECIFTLTVNEVLGIEDVFASAITMYPNPTDGTLQIENFENVNLKSIVIYDISGSLVKNETVEKGVSKTTLNLESLSSGVYLIKLYTDTATIIKKLIKQ